MPVVKVIADELFDLLGLHYDKSEYLTKAKDEFSDLCFEFGIELDDVTSEKEMAARGEISEKDANSDLLEKIVYKIDVPANRYDLLSVEGIARALNIFRMKQQPPKYVSLPATCEMKVDPIVNQVRTYIVCGILRNIKFTPLSYKSFIDMQDKLHQTIGKRRALVSIGTHDLDTVKAPFHYTAKKPEDIKFIPLKRTTEIDAKQLMIDFEKDLKLREFLPIIRDSPVYPVVMDDNGVIMSLPPIINGEHSKITLDTKNVFVEITCTDLNKGRIVLETVLATFSQYCAKPYECEQVTVISPYQNEGKPVAYPDYSIDRKHTASVDFINNALGLKLSKDDILKHLTRMSLEATSEGDEKTVIVRAPPTRSDVLHQCDLMEDVAIAHGFNNIVPNPTCTKTVGKQLEKTKFIELLSQEVCGAGYCEVMTWILCNCKDNFEYLRRKDDNSGVMIGNTKNGELFQTARVSIIPGLLKCVASNKTSSCPIKLFEVGDCVVKDSSNPIGAKNVAKIAAIYANVTAGYEQISGLLDRIMQVCCISPKFMTTDTSKPVYELKQYEDPLFIANLGVEVLLNGKHVGIMGVVHPEVLNNFGVTHPCSVLELDTTPFVEFL